MIMGSTAPYSVLYWEFLYRCGDADSTQPWRGPVKTVGFPAGSWIKEICWPVWTGRGHSDKELCSVHVDGLEKTESSHCGDITCRCSWKCNKPLYGCIPYLVHGEELLLWSYLMMKTTGRTKVEIRNDSPLNYSKICCKQKTMTHYLCIAHVGVTVMCVSSLLLTFPTIMRIQLTVWANRQILVLPSLPCKPT